MTPNWFIAYPVPPSDWFAPLIATAPSSLRRFHPDDLHITLAFLGGVSADVAELAWAEAVRTAPPAVTVSFGPIEPFGNPAKPSAFALTLDTHRDRVAAHMAAHTNALLAKAGARPERRPPRPHATVARPPRKAADAVRRAGALWARTAPPVQAHVTLDQLALYTWTQNRQERLFRKVHTLDLAEP